MGRIKDEDIVAYRISVNSIDEKIVCRECVTEEETYLALQRNIITLEDLENDSGATTFCDRCEKPLGETLLK